METKEPKYQVGQTLVYVPFSGSILHTQPRTERDFLVESIEVKDGRIRYFNGNRFIYEEDVVRARDIKNETLEKAKEINPYRKGTNSWTAFNEGYLAAALGNLQS